jgi:hypothetical protein
MGMELRVSTPCPMSWEALKGGDLVRYCGKCNLNVYNLAGMQKGEIESLVRRTEGRLCGRIYMRGDRTATVQPCRGAAIRKKTRALLTLGTLLVVGVLSWLFRTQAHPDRGICPPIVKDALDWIDPPPRPPGRMMLGEIACPPPKPPTPPPQPVAPESPRE